MIKDVNSNLISNNQCDYFSPVSAALSISQVAARSFSETPTYRRFFSNAEEASTAMLQQFDKVKEHHFAESNRHSGSDKEIRNEIFYQQLNHYNFFIETNSLRSKILTHFINGNFLAGLMDVNEAIRRWSVDYNSFFIFSVMSLIYKNDKQKTPAGLKSEWRDTNTNYLDMKAAFCSPIHHQIVYVAENLVDVELTSTPLFKDELQIAFENESNIVTHPSLFEIYLYERFLRGDYATIRKKCSLFLSNFEFARSFLLYSAAIDIVENLISETRMSLIKLKTINTKLFPNNKNHLFLLTVNILEACSLSDDQDFKMTFIKIVLVLNQPIYFPRVISELVIRLTKNLDYKTFRLEPLLHQVLIEQKKRHPDNIHTLFLEVYLKKQEGNLADYIKILESEISPFLSFYPEENLVIGKFYQGKNIQKEFSALERYHLYNPAHVPTRLNILRCLLSDLTPKLPRINALIVSTSKLILEFHRTPYFQGALHSSIARCNFLKNEFEAGKFSALVSNRYLKEAATQEPSPEISIEINNYFITNYSYLLAVHVGLEDWDAAEDTAASLETHCPDHLTTLKYKLKKSEREANLTFEYEILIKINKACDLTHAYIRRILFLTDRLERYHELSETLKDTPLDKLDSSAVRHLIDIVLHHPDAKDLIPRLCTLKNHPLYNSHTRYHEILARYYLENKKFKLCKSSMHKGLVIDPDNYGLQKIKEILEEKKGDGSVTGDLSTITTQNFAPKKTVKDEYEQFIEAKQKEELTFNHGGERDKIPLPTAFSYKKHYADLIEKAEKASKNEVISLPPPSAAAASSVHTPSSSPTEKFALQSKKSFISHEQKQAALIAGREHFRLCLEAITYSVDDEKKLRIVFYKLFMTLEALRWIPEFTELRHLRHDLRHFPEKYQLNDLFEIVHALQHQQLHECISAVEKNKFCPLFICPKLSRIGAIDQKKLLIQFIKFEVEQFAGWKNKVYSDPEQLFADHIVMGAMHGSCLRIASALVRLKDNHNIIFQYDLLHKMIKYAGDIAHLDASKQISTHQLQDYLTPREVLRFMTFIPKVLGNLI